ncbi:hypothetical protein EDM56_30545 [Brevibacillus fluminis]|uniref:Uncharacterized protein n=1 Tax=Brevibacillus fluminis TaxID=511487 RepID=A0A3M8CSE2_9BACL|nr:hypothetical protein EDM56_30545 [Brevibacillus fluminis]
MYSYQHYVEEHLFKTDALETINGSRIFYECGDGGNGKCRCNDDVCGGVFWFSPECTHHVLK